MRKLCIRIVSFLLIFGLAAAAAGKLADVPPSFRPRNWPAEDDGSGSCVNASTILCLNYAGYEQMAAWWRTAHEGGETLNSAFQHLEDCGLPYACTAGNLESGMAFLHWAEQNRIACGMFFGPWHAQNMVGYVNGYWAVVDNNHPERIDWYSDAKFREMWEADGCVAWCFVTPPPPPWPKLK